MDVLIASSEAVPFCKTGGLADVAGTLPKELEKLGLKVRLLLPLYKKVKREPLRPTGLKIKVFISDRFEEASLWQGKTGRDVPVYFIEKDKYYDRPELYQTSEGDYPDNAERFLFFSRAILEASKVLDLKPDIIHLNDWQTAMASVYLKTLYKDDPCFKRTASLLTIHNLGYQGLFWHLDMHLTGLGWEFFTPEGIEFYGKISLLKGGIVFSDIINTVSKTYSREIQTEEFGFGLDGVLRKRREDLYGIINGIDYDEWDPSRNGSIPSQFGLNDMKGKDICKRAVQKEMGLEDTGYPLIGMITRLAGQKGLDILSESIEDIMKLDLQLIILGEGEETYHKKLSSISRKYPSRIGVKIGFDPVLARKIYAGSDFFLMPSRYEPCGLGQMISLRYGTIPIVRKTGGLADTVKEFSLNRSYKTYKTYGNGFLFEEYSARALFRAIKKALGIYKDKRLLPLLVSNAMSCDFSWSVSAKKYLDLYKKAVKKVVR